MAEKTYCFWYHWINGLLSKEEITKDMEAMKEEGFGALWFDTLFFKNISIVFFDHGEFFIR